jgi:hypothetical protein
MKITKSSYQSFIRSVKFGFQPFKSPMLTLAVLIPAFLLLFIAACDSMTGSNPAEEPESQILAQQSFNGEAISRPGKAAHQSSNIFWFADGTVVDGASASLLRTHNNIRMRIQTHDLDPGDTYTVWWVVFNSPDECEHPVDGMANCSEPDLFNDAVGGSVLYAAGHVIGSNGKGNFAGSLRQGDLSGCQAPWNAFDLELIGEEGELDMCRDGLVDSQGAEIHLVIRSHGEKIPGMVNDQINTFAGGCTAESSFGAADGPNECEDQQAAIFLPY